MAVLYYPPTTNGLQKTLDAALDAGVTASATLNNVTGIQNEPGVFVVNRIDSNGNVLPSNGREYISYTGTSGSTVVTLTRGLGGSTDQDHAIGEIVEFIPDISWAQSVITALSILVDADDISIIKLTSPRVVTGINDTNGNELVKVTATSSAVNEVTLANAATGNNPTVTMSGGDTNIGLNLKMKGTAYFKKPIVVHIPFLGSGTDATTGDGKAFFETPEELNGMNIVAVGAYNYVAGTTNTMDIQLRNVTQAADILSTKVTIDTTERSSRTAAAPAVINTSEDDLQTGDMLAVDVDAIHTTAAKGGVFWIRCELP